MISFTVNGKPHSVDVPGDTPLLWVLRDHLRLTGTKFGCGESFCGACTVHIDGKPAKSCSVEVGKVAGKSVTTIEGIAGPVIEALRAAWSELDVPQCGYCHSGQLMRAADLLAHNPRPDDEQIDAAMNGNLCRCATYQRIRDGIHAAARRLGA
ncbi:MAG: (2Fe-2S)-binding protein [Gallionellaceae bacterium]|nr:(2Fe-2S)-binding protein [Gallionellaceae bacterium]